MPLPQSHLIASHCISSILKQAYRDIYIAQLIESSLAKYCSQQAHQYYEQSLVYNQELRVRDQYQVHPQPSPLLQDNFFPTATDVETAPPQSNRQAHRSEDKNRVLVRNKTQKSVSHAPSGRKQKLESRSVYEKLNIEEPEEQPTIYNQMRKHIIEQHDARQTTNQQKREQVKKRQSGRQEKVAFGYAGQVMKLKQQNKVNLISKGLTGSTLAEAQKLKSIINQKVEITDLSSDKKQRKAAKPSSKNNQIEFTNVKTLLLDVKASKGIKITEGGSTIQQKQAAMPVTELMKNISQRKLSKKQYQRIKQADAGSIKYEHPGQQNKNLNNLTEHQIQQKTEQNDLHMRSISESKLSKVLTKNKSSVTVNDASLLQALVSQQQKYPEQSYTQRKNAEQERSGSKLDSIDQYNLNYIRNGGSINSTIKSKSISEMESVRLPKIATSRDQMPKPRQRLKDKDEIVRAIRRKFEQKLRI